MTTKAHSTPASAGSARDGTLYLGLDIGGTKSAVIVGAADGNVLDRVQWPSEARRGAQPLLDDVLNRSRAMLGKHRGIVAVGVSIGGPMDGERGVIHGPPNLPGWDAIPLKQILESALGLPAAVEHDAAACALAEHRWGAGRGARRLAYLTCGTGFGVGLVFDGKAYYGARGRSIEIGHVRYRDDGPVAFGKQGCFESYAAGSSLPRLAAWRFPERWAADPPDGAAISSLRAGGDPDAADIILANAGAVGDACALLGDLLFLETIILGSLARYLGDEWFSAVQDRFKRQVLPAAADGCRIVRSGLGDRLQDCSALVAAMQAG